MPATPKPRLRLPRRRIVRSRRFFDAAFVEGKARRISSRFMTLLVLPREESGSSAAEEEVAFLVPKRIGDAHFRNRLRRRLREAYRIHFAPEPHRRLLWLAKTAAAALTPAALLADMKEVYARSL